MHLLDVLQKNLRSERLVGHFNNNLLLHHQQVLDVFACKGLVYTIWAGELRDSRKFRDRNIVSETEMM
jgi:hypothetical protein